MGEEGREGERESKRVRLRNLHFSCSLHHTFSFLCVFILIFLIHYIFFVYLPPSCFFTSSFLASSFPVFVIFFLLLFIFSSLPCPLFCQSLPVFFYLYLFILSALISFLPLSLNFFSFRLSPPVSPSFPLFSTLSPLLVYFFSYFYPRFCLPSFLFLQISSPLSLPLLFPF